MITYPFTYKRAKSLAEAMHHVDSRHDHARRAEAALQAVVLAKCLLHGMQLVLGRKALDREHGRAFSLQRQHGAGFDGLAVDMDDAAAALRRVAAHMRPGQAKLLTQQLHQEGAGLDGGLDGFTVHGERNGRHGKLLICRSDKTVDRAKRRQA